MKIRIAVICPSEIAFRKFMPALLKIDDIEYVGVGINSVKERYGAELPSVDVQNLMLQNQRRKAEQFVKLYGGIIFDSYESVVTSNLVDAVYIPLPPALHFYWGERALHNRKHILLEKPSTTCISDTQKLISIAQRNNLAIHENYMFIYHKQIEEIDDIIKSGEIGDVRLYSVRFGFPRRDKEDFRYNKDLGGGALMDAAGYTIKYATNLLGESIHLLYSHINYIDEFDVDMYGAGAFSNDDGVVAQIAYGMDNDYKCELEVWGSKGTLVSGRVLTSPTGYVPTATISKNGVQKTITLSEDDAFMKSIEVFISCVKENDIRNTRYSHILKQASLLEDFRRKVK